MEYTEHSWAAGGVRSFSTPGFLAKLGDDLGLSQAVVIPPNVSLVVTSGHIGFKEDLSIPENLQEQLALAFEHAEKSLKSAGVTDGWKSVYQMTTYAPSIDEEWELIMLKLKDKYMGKIRPAWTGIVVPSLYGGAKLEMTLYAFITPSK
jgi:enamine deaminase RidA (YjgF/YER057c/UK114 family)